MQEVVRFDVKSPNGGRVQVLEADVVPVVKNDFPHLRDLWFSDVCRTKEELETEIPDRSGLLVRVPKEDCATGESKEPVAVETELGWVLSGPLRRQDANSQWEVSVNVVAQDSVALDRASLDSEVSRFWDLKSLGIKSSDELHESLENNIEFFDGRYSIKLPWKQGHDPFPATLQPV